MGCSLYNPYLLTRYNCHLNVEICSAIKVVKYLYKYIYKGHDRATSSIGKDDDEIKIVNEIHFQDARWVSALEALWRFFYFGLNVMHPAVINLQLYLPNQRLVSYWKNQNLWQLVRFKYASKKQCWQIFLKIFQAHEDARKLLYKDFSKYYVWDRSVIEWNLNWKHMVDDYKDKQEFHDFPKNPISP